MTAAAVSPRKAIETIAPQHIKAVFVAFQANNGSLVNFRISKAELRRALTPMPEAATMSVIVGSDYATVLGPLPLPLRLSSDGAPTETEAT